MSRRDKMFYYPKPQLKDLILGFAESNKMSKSEVCNHFAREFFSKMTPAEKSRLLAAGRRTRKEEC